MDYTKIKAPYINNKEIKKKADLFRQKFWDDSIPVDIETIIDVKLKIDVIPSLNLKQECDSDTLISSDWKSKCSEAQILSFVVFPNAGKLKISGTDSVGYTRDIIRKIEDHKAQIFTDAERDEVYNILANANIQDKELRKLHNKGVRELKDAKATNHFPPRQNLQ